MRGQGGVFCKATDFEHAKGIYDSTRNKMVLRGWWERVRWDINTDFAYRYPVFTSVLCYYLSFPPQFQTFSWYLQPLSEYAWIGDSDFLQDTVRLSQKRGQNGWYVDQADICSSLQCPREFRCCKIICPDVRTGRALRYSEGLSGCLSSCS